MFLSGVPPELTTGGVAHLEEPLRLRLDPTTGPPVLFLGRTVTAAEVADALADE